MSANTIGSLASSFVGMEIQSMCPVFEDVLWSRQIAANCSIWGLFGRHFGVILVLWARYRRCVEKMRITFWRSEIVKCLLYCAESSVTDFTAVFNDMRTLKFKIKLTIAFRLPSIIIMALATNHEHWPITTAKRDVLIRLRWTSVSERSAKMIDGTKKRKL